ncbi:hypothetical protein BDP27DRAFT_1404776 [Rhodocollybia butyracea]|uniref:DUF6534 domain-containing protein n=1 Tax=Rhodocollybia butyracea TaxID=206335 RepID=A0A9P5PLT9_9AGAR|nr:hypothetical protein BDP27DRAFT_1404776 [Rhodocollybia butyracea]
MASPLDSTYGVWLVALWLATILYGVGLLQTWLYFHWYSNDHWGVKLTVVFLVVTETVQISALFGATYQAFVNGFGDDGLIRLVHNSIEALQVELISGKTQLLAGFLSAFIVQMYFAWVIFLLNSKQKAATLLIMALALTQLGAGLNQGVITTILGSLRQIEDIKTVFVVQSAASLACDAVITLSLCLILRNNRTGMESTNTLIQKLMVNAINRGALTTLAAALEIILFLAVPGTFYFVLFLMTTSKLYMNSMLATLNTRRHIRHTTAHISNDPGPWSSIHLARLSTVSNGTNAPTYTAFHSDDTVSINQPGTLKRNLVENMI